MNPMLLVTASLGDKIDTAFYGFDMWVYSIFGSLQCGFLTVVAKIFTAFGDERFVIPMAVLGVVMCFFKRTRKYGFSLLFAIAIGTIVTNVLVKPAVLRIRPYNTLQAKDIWEQYSVWYKNAGALSESDYSFPSGHTTAAFEIAVSMGLCLRSKGLKKQSYIPLCIAICTMGSRVYLMVHYATDVIGGMIVGTLAGVCAYFLAKLACMIFEKVKFLDAIDAEKLFEKITKKPINTKSGVCAIMAAVVLFFCISYIPAMSEGGDSIRCDYSPKYFDGAAYDCQNEAKVDVDKDGNVTYKDDYPELEGYEGMHFCKIHYKELKARSEENTQVRIEENAQQANQ